MENSKLPLKISDHNLLIGTWNIRNFGGVFPEWKENTNSPKRNLRALVYISEIIRRFDVVAIQEVKADTSGIRMLLDRYLGPNWGIIVSDVSAGSQGNTERLAFLYDKRRVQPSGLAGEIVLPPTSVGDPQDQFARTPYIVGFRTENEKFALLTAHIKYGDKPVERLPEIKALSAYIAREIRSRAKGEAEEVNLIVLGDFNIDQRGDDPLFQAFVSTGLVVPQQLLNQRTTYNTNAKYYDQIAWFLGDLDLIYNNQASVIDFVDAVFKEYTPLEMSFRMSDHFPLWVEFITDRSSEQMARVLGVDPGDPNPFRNIPD
jgi:endonuclease/exonuclease/phosphatase family metal-dependent hydrolase